MHPVFLATFSICMTLGMSAKSFGEGSRYRHCNIFATGVCFGIAAGDQLVQTIPIDYVLYEVELSSGATVTVYNGMNPPRLRDYKIITSTAKRNWRAHLMKPPSADDPYVFEIAPKDKSVFRISTWSISDPQTLDFLSNFRFCPGGERLERRCKDEFPLRHLIQGDKTVSD